MRFSTLLLAAACAAPLAVAQTVELPDQIYVANQGGFGANTSSLTLSSATPFSTDADQLFIGQFGSTIQSTTLIGDRLYVMSDEAGRIDVIDVSSNTRVAQIASPDVNSVRYLAQVGPGRAYVTQLYLPDGSFSGGSVAVVDLETNTFTGVINDDSFSNPEGIAVIDGLAFVANGGFGAGTTLTVIDTSTDAVLRVDEIGCAARAVLPDEQDGEVYAFCEDEVVAVTAAMTLDGEPGIRRLSVPEGIRPLGTGGLGQDAAAFVPDASFFGDPSFGIADLAAVGTGGVMLLDSRTDEATALEIEGESPITALGYALYFSQGGPDIISFPVLFVGRPDADNPFSATGTVTAYDAFVGDELNQFAAGVYPTSVSISTVFATDAEPSAEDKPFALAGVFPNPAVGQATAAFSLAKAASVQLRMFDVLGREVLRADGAFGPGEQQIDLDTSALTPGLYVVRLDADGQAATARFTVAR